MQVYSGLQSQVGLMNQVSNGFSWMLLRCIHDDQKVHSAQWLALKAVCNTKLAVALTIMEECFLSMLDPRTGIHMIPQLLYNWGLVPLSYDPSSSFSMPHFLGFLHFVFLSSVAFWFENLYLSVNFRSDFARLNFQGFYTVVLEKQDILISVASIR